MECLEVCVLLILLSLGSVYDQMYRDSPGDSKETEITVAMLVVMFIYLLINLLKGSKQFYAKYLARIQNKVTKFAIASSPKHVQTKDEAKSVHNEKAVYSIRPELVPRPGVPEL